MSPPHTLKEHQALLRAIKMAELEAKNKELAREQLLRIQLILARQTPRPK